MPKEPTARVRVFRWFNRAWQNVRARFAPGAEEAQELVALDTTGRRDRKLYSWPDVPSWLVVIGGMAAQILFLPRTEDRQDVADAISSRMHNKHLNAWTDVHSWLVVMGGLAFEDTAPEDQKLMPWSGQRFPVSQDMFEFIVDRRPHLVPDISRGYIEDKSKSDWLAKGLTCWQAGYFCIQCTFRLSQQLLITLLELNVFAHAICALSLFLVWWDKPRDVLVPTAISSDEALHIFACHADPWRFRFTDARGSVYRATAVPILKPPALERCFEIIGTVHPKTLVVRKHADSTMFMILSHRNYYEFLKLGDTYWQLRGIERFTINAGLDANRCYDSNIDFTLSDRAFARLIKVYENVTQSRPPNQGISSSKAWKTPPEARAPDWSLGDEIIAFIIDVGTQPDHVRTIAGITFAGAFYGGLHLVGWTAAFPSHAALLMWRAASVTILATGPFCGAIIAYEWLYRRSSRSKKSLGVIDWTMSALTLLFSVWYVVCRTFIVVECFILLAHIPESALRVPTWATYIPSFG